MPFASTNELPGLLQMGMKDSYRDNGAIKKASDAGDGRPNFLQLQDIERHRRDILLRAELPFWRILLFFRSTCLEDMTKDVLVWITLAVYVGIRLHANAIDYVPDTVALLENTNIGVLGGFLSFFLVVFVNQTNARFLDMYGFSKACSGRIQDIAGYARAQLPPEVGARLLRYLHAAHIAGYVGLDAIGQGSPYSREHFFGVYNQRHRLLTPDELARLDDMGGGGKCMKELCTWAQEEVSDARRAGRIDTFQEDKYHDKILAFRAAMDGIYDYTDQPPHFFYIHFLVLLSTIYLPLFAIDTAYSTGWGDEAYLVTDLLNGVVVLLQCVFVVGLRSLGTKMVDPYGDDYEDLSVILYVESTFDNCAAILGRPREAVHKPGGAPAAAPGVKEVATQSSSCRSLAGVAAVSKEGAAEPPGGADGLASPMMDATEQHGGFEGLVNPVADTYVAPKVPSSEEDAQLV